MKIVVWQNLRNDTYYYKLVNGRYKDYRVGDRNSYNHKIILVIDNVYDKVYKVSLKRRLIKRMIRFLEKL